MVQFQLGQLIWYMRNGRPHSAPILSRRIVENLHEDWAYTPEQKELFTSFGKSSVYYMTCHGLVDGNEAFSKKEHLIEYLFGER